jgi:hypothetical protein
LNPEIRDYIQANRGTYTPESIRQQLREAGHSEEAIDATWRALDREEQAESGAALPQRRAVATAQFWVLLVITACVALTVLPLGGAFLLGLLYNFAQGLGLPGSNSGIEVLIGSIVVLVLGYLAIGLGGWRLMRRDRAAALGIFSGLATAFVLSVVVAGLCVALLQSL